MKNTITNCIVALIVTTLLALGGIAQNRKDAAASFTANKAPEAASNSIVGTWYVDATPDGAPPFKGMITFSEGGVMIASAQGDILQNAGSLATAGHGAWLRTANREFIFTFRQILYNADGDYDGGVKVRHDAILSRDGNTWTGRLTVEYFDANDVLVFTGTGNGTARRIAAEAP